MIIVSFEAFKPFEEEVGAGAVADGITDPVCLLVSFEV
jgi:hypothetical protein